MKIDALATQRHYAAHLLPIWLALDDSERGTFHAGHAARATLAAAGIAPGRAQVGRGPGPVMVAAQRELRSCRNRPAILLEHGAGQHYGGEPAKKSGGYAGGFGRETVRLFLVPNHAAAQRNAEVYPAAVIEVVGVPKMDRWHLLKHEGQARGSLFPPSDEAAKSEVVTSGEYQSLDVTPVDRLSTKPLARNRAKKSSNEPTVCISFHWPCKIVPEANWVWPHFESVLASLAERFDLIGHGHPRAYGFLARRYRERGIEAVRDFDEVLERADVYVADNSSTLYEFASTGRPVVCMNAPWYRRDVEHGLRFWSAVPGVQVDEPHDLASAVEIALDDPPACQELRRRAVGAAYAFTDGQATDRAVAAIRETF